MNKNIECQIISVHEGKVEDAQNFLRETPSEDLMAIFHKVCDSNKVKIILSLLKTKEMCVCDISIILNMTIASTSHHLRLLYKNDVLDKYRKGKMVYYFIKDTEIKNFFEMNLTKESYRS